MRFFHGSKGYAQRFCQSCLCKRNLFRKLTESVSWYYYIFCISSVHFESDFFKGFAVAPFSASAGRAGKAHYIIAACNPLSKPLPIYPFSQFLYNATPFMSGDEWVFCCNIAIQYFQICGTDGCCFYFYPYKSPGCLWNRHFF